MNKKEFHKGCKKLMKVKYFPKDSLHYLDEVKRTKYSKLTSQEKRKQKRYADNFIAEMMFRKDKGNEKYGNYMVDVDFKRAFKEFEEECMDACNHLIMLSYKLRKECLGRAKLLDK